MTGLRLHHGGPTLVAFVFVEHGDVILANAHRRTHWTQRAAAARTIRTLFANALWLESIDALDAPRPWDRVEVEFLYVYHGRGRLPDADAIAPTAKAALDGIVDSGIITDDTPDVVRSITYHAPERSSHALHSAPAIHALIRRMQPPTQGEET